MSYPSPHAARIGLALGLALLASAVRPATAAAPSRAPTDSAGTGTIHGLVVGSHGLEAFANVVVVGTRRRAASDEHGSFRITLVPTGTWQLMVQAIGYESATVNVAVRAGRDTEVILTVSERPEQKARRHPVPDCDSTWRAPVSPEVALPDTAGWWTASGSIFDFSLPTEFRRKQVIGIDSEFGEWVADSSRITYELGGDSGCTQPGNGAFAGASECVSGFRAGVNILSDSHTYLVEICFPCCGLGLHGSSPDSTTRARILAAFRTIRFHDAGAPPILTGPAAPDLPLNRPPGR